MQLNKKFFLINFFIIFFSSFASADNKIAYIDLDLILSESNPSKSLFSQLKKIEEKKLLSTKNIIAKDEYNKNVINFKKKVDNFRNAKNTDIENLKKKRNREILRFFKLINPIIEKIMEENSIEILFEKKNIFIAKSNYDITQIIIENINKNINEFKIQE